LAGAASVEEERVHFVGIETEPGSGEDVTVLGHQPIVVRQRQLAEQHELDDAGGMAEWADEGRHCDKAPERVREAAPVEVGEGRKVQLV